MTSKITLESLDSLVFMYYVVNPSCKYYESNFYIIITGFC